METTTAKKYVYFFGNGRAEGGAAMRDLLGGKGANVAEMTNIGIPVPPGFTISTEACGHFMTNAEQFPNGLDREVADNVRKLESAMGAGFGDASNPLLVSVRSGARVSMPGMMDTVLNLGLNDETAEGLSKKTGNPRFAFDSYRRFIQMYSNVVMGIDVSRFEKLLAEKRLEAGVKSDNELPASSLESLVDAYQKVVVEHAGTVFPQTALDQLWGAIAAVFNSWNSPRAISYRDMHDYPAEWGTAVNVQAMVFGNMGDDCATGVAFTRHPSTGDKRFFGEYLVNAQGEDVVAGIRTPLPINEYGGQGDLGESLKGRMPAIYSELERVYQTLEGHYRDMQDIEFTIQSGKLWMLQTRSGKRTGRAAVKIAVDMTREGLIDQRTAIGRVEPGQLEQLLHPMIDPAVDAKPISKGLPASPGAASGRVVIGVEDAVRRAKDGEDVILVRTETSPEDLDGMKVARAILTTRGGMTSHAAVVARGMGKCCVVGCSTLHIDAAGRRITLGDRSFAEGDEITLEGSTGSVYDGRLPTVDAELDSDFHDFMEWVDTFRTLKVRANADTPGDASTARAFGAEGIGLARTEHMFFAEDRIDVVRRMIIAGSTDDRVAALNEILPMQRDDFIGVFRAMDGFPVTIRLLDPPLHEFLPSDAAEVEALARRLDVDAASLHEAVEDHREFNPMLGHRGCRLGITYPEIYDTQVRAIVEAACTAAGEGLAVYPEIMVPLVGSRSELSWLRTRIVEIADAIIAERGTSLAYHVGTMIEVPRAAVVAESIAEVSDFFSFGTNDLTQMAYGFSRDDSGPFIREYLERGILKHDPFESLDTEGVGALVRMAVEGGRRTNPKLKLGICGEHGGDPASIRFCHVAGLDYVSCSPYRVPIARLAAAQASLNP